MARGFNNTGSYSAAEPSTAGYSALEVPPLEDEPIAPNRDPQAVKIAIEFRNAVLKVEPTVTQKLARTVMGLGGKMVGLKNRVKTADSLARKIFESKDESRFKGDMVEVAKNLFDVVRYTASFEEDKYVEGVKATLQALKDDGYTFSVKNYWEDGDTYQGINVKLFKDGVQSELQFHTPDSFEKKRIGHEFFKLQRSEKDLVKRKEYWDKQLVIANSVRHPKGYEELLKLETLTKNKFE